MKCKQILIAVSYCGCVAGWDFVDAFVPINEIVPKN